MPPLTLADLPPWFVRGLAVVFGLLWGSFLNVVIHRVPRGMSVARPPSHCPACDTPIPFYRNVPVISWLLRRGKAACCGAPIAPRYILVELLGGVLSLAVLEGVVLPLGPSTTALHAGMVYLANFSLALGLTAAAFIDLEHMILPDAITLGGVVLGIATFAFRDLQLVDAVVGAVVGFLIVWLPFIVIYPRLRGQVGMGMGDAKLLAVAGAWFGWGGALVVLGAGAVQGTVAMLVLLASGRRFEEPEEVRREREELERELETASPERRAELEAEWEGDPLRHEEGEGFGQMRLAFGPFLILAILETQLLGRERIFGWLLGL